MDLAALACVFLLSGTSGSVGLRLHASVTCRLSPAQMVASTRQRLVAVVLLSLLSAAGSGCAARVERTNETPWVAGEEADVRAVYAALLAAESDRYKGRMVVRAETARDWAPAGCIPTAAEGHAWRTAVDDYISRRRLPARIPADLARPRAGYVVRPGAEIRGGYLTLSAVGFDASRTRAIVHLEHVCRPYVDCGRGGERFVEKQEGQWRPVTPTGVGGCGWIG